MKLLMLCGCRLSPDETAFLDRHGYRVNVVPDLPAALGRAQGLRYDALTLDLDGLHRAPAEVVGLMRQVTDAPLVLTRLFVDEVDQIVALEAGADAVIPQPLSPRLLLAHLRRIDRIALGDVVPSLRSASYGPICVDMAKRSVAWRGRALDLCGSHVAILSVLTSARGRPVSRESLLKALGRSRMTARTMDTAISRLRSRLEQQGAGQIGIQAVSRIGYRIVLCLSAPSGAYENAAVVRRPQFA